MSNQKLSAKAGQLRSAKAGQHHSRIIVPVVTRTQVALIVGVLNYEFGKD